MGLKRKYIVAFPVKKKKKALLLVKHMGMRKRTMVMTIIRKIRRANNLLNFKYVPHIALSTPLI